MKKMRMTSQREIILQELKKFSGHPSADELYGRVKKLLPRISLATVYRNLEILSEAGDLKKIEISGRQKRFDWDVQQHHHICCIDCHRVDNIELARTGHLTPHPGDDRGYAISGCRIEFYGYCPACRQTKNRQKSGHTKDSASPKTTLHDRQRNVLAALAGSNTACSSRDIAAAIGIDAAEVSRHLISLKKKGHVKSPARCRYEITRDGKKIVEQGEKS